MSAEMYLTVGTIVAMIVVAFPVTWMVWWLLADLAGGSREARSYGAREQRRQRAA